jgi:hypothetical protein
MLMEICPRFRRTRIFVALGFVCPLLASCGGASDPGAPAISWVTPAAITYGAALSAAQLDATASIPGAFTYTPAPGAVLTAGSHTLSTTFTPADTTAYSTANASVTVTVN